MTDAPPETVRCPCGNGEARRLTDSTRHTTPHGAFRSETFHYRHAACHVGGAIIVMRDRALRKGPLFHPARYGVGASDGGDR